MDAKSRIGSSRAKPLLGVAASLALVLQVVAASPSSAGTLEVCATGCAYSSIQDAIDAAATGDTILVSPGTYVEALELDKGVHLLARTFDEGAPENNTAVIDGDGASAVITIPSGVTSQPRLTGFVIRNGSSDGIYPRSPFTVEYSYFTDADDLIDYERGSGGVLRQSVFEGAGDDAVDLDSPNVDLLIEGNRILSSRQDGIEIRLQDDSLASQAVTTIRDNEIRGSGEDGIQLIDYDTDTNRLFVIEGNLITNNRIAAIGLMDDEDTDEDLRAASIREPINVIGNTIVDNNAGISGGDNLVAVNNIVARNTLFGLKNVDGGSIASHNLFYGNNPDFTGTNNVDRATTLHADPLLDADFELQPGSPAIDAGTASFAWNGRAVVSLTAADYVGAAPDLGWYEAPGGAPEENRPPVISSVSIDPPSPRTNDTLTVTVRASDADADVLTYSYQWLDDGTAIDGATGPALDLSVAGNGDAGDALAVRVTASDGTDTSAPMTSAAVTVVNSPPVFDQDLGDRTSQEGDVVSLSAKATDADGDLLTYGATGLPTGLSADTSSGLISGTIGAGAAADSPYPTSVTVSDGAGSAAADTFTWTVGAPAAREIVFRSAASNAERNATSISVPRPAGVRSGDVLVAAVSLRGTPDITAPTGWTLARVDTNGSAMRQAVYTLVATTGEPSSYEWAFSARTESAAAMVVAYQGVDPAAPVMAASGQPNESSSSITAPSVTTSVSGAMLVGVFGIGINPTITEPTGMIERAQVVQGVGPEKVALAGADEVHAAAAATGSRTATTTPRTGPNIGQLIALRPQR